MIKVYDIELLQCIFGTHATLYDIKKLIQSDATIKCPKCHGKGFVRIKYDASADGLLNNNCVEDWKYKDIGCDMCNEMGYARHLSDLNM